MVYSKVYCMNIQGSYTSRCIYIYVGVCGTKLIEFYLYTTYVQCMQYAILCVCVCVYVCV